MRLLVLVTAGLAYALAFLFSLPVLWNLLTLTPSSTYGTLLLVLWPAPLAATLWLVLAWRKKAHLGRAEARAGEWCGRPRVPRGHR